METAVLPEEQTSVEASFPTVGRWLVTALPRGWVYVLDFGIRQLFADVRDLPANISLGQDELAGPDQFEAYVANQSRLINQHLSKPAIAGPQATSFLGAEEALLFFVRHSSQSDINMLHAQTYVRCGCWVGIVTLTTHESQLKAVRSDDEAFLKGLRIHPA